MLGESRGHPAFHTLLGGPSTQDACHHPCAQQQQHRKASAEHFFRAFQSRYLSRRNPGTLRGNLIAARTMKRVSVASEETEELTSSVMP